MTARAQQLVLIRYMLKAMACLLNMGTLTTSFAFCCLKNFCIRTTPATSMIPDTIPQMTIQYVEMTLVINTIDGTSPLLTSRMMNRMA